MHIHIIPIACVHFTASYSDFEGLNQTVRFSSKQCNATVYINIKDDNIVESTEAFQVEILIPHSLHLRGIQFGNISKAKVYIKDGMETYKNFHLLYSYIYIFHLDDKVIVTKSPPTTPRKFSYANVHIMCIHGFCIKIYYT